MKRGAETSKSGFYRFTVAGLIASAMLTLAPTAHAADAKKPASVPVAKAAPGAKPGDPAKPPGFRKKELNFEERVIEGLSNKGYESLSQTGTSDALKGEKLYRKRAEFDDDSKSLLREMEYLK